METFDTCIRQNSNRICYMILPRGIRNEALDLEALSEKYSVSIVQVNGVDWNDDLTPWPAPGVFKKAKPFGGCAAAFLDKFVGEVIPETEKTLGVENAERTVLGVSLSGLFALWAGYNTDAFANIVSISGSLWYDGFVEWVKEHSLSFNIKKVCLLLGEKEKNSKEKRMAGVEDDTRAVAETLSKNRGVETFFEMVEGTHFSPTKPRLERAFELTMKIS